MNDEQKDKRKESADTGKIRWIKEHCLRTKDDDDDYVFISYKSDDFETVLDDILYNTCKKYGLRVYFDTAFDEDSDSWITQYEDNMCDPHCKAFIAFIDDAYYSSYACLLEMMTRKTLAAGGDYREDSLFFLPINIGSITDVTNNSNTGLGTKRFSDGKININAQVELEKFNEVFSELERKDKNMSAIYKRKQDTQLYEEAYKDSPKYGKVYLTVTQCRRLMEHVIPNSNENDGRTKKFEDVIHDKLVKAGLGSVFDPNWTKPPVDIINGEKNNTLRIKKGDAIPKQDSGNREGYEEGHPTLSINEETLLKDKNDCHSVNETKETVEIVSDGSIFHIKGRDGIYDAFYRKDNDRYTVLRGSKVRYNENYTPKRLWEQNKNNITAEGYLLCDIGDLSISAAARLIRGAFTTGKELDDSRKMMGKNESYTVSIDSSRNVGPIGDDGKNNEHSIVNTNGDIKNTPRIKEDDAIPKQDSGIREGVDENTTLEEFEKICEKTNICELMKAIRSELGAQPVDYLMASLLRGCDKKIQDTKKGKPVGPPLRRAAYNYCYNAISQSTSNQFTWQSNARKWVAENEQLPKYFGKDGHHFKGSGKLFDYSEIFECLDKQTTIGDILNKYHNGEKGFITRDNKRIVEVWEKIKGLNPKPKKRDLQEFI